MLQVTTLRENTEKVLESLRKKNFLNAENIVTEIITLDNQRKKIQQKMDDILAESNILAKEIGLLMRDRKMEEAQSLKQKTIELKEQSKLSEQELKKTTDLLYSCLVTLPNLPHSSVPEGKTPEENEVVRQSKEALPPLFEEALPHWELIKKYNIIDFELGTKITGAGFPVYRGKGAKLQRALIQFFLDEAVKAGYEEIAAPILVNEHSAFGTGQLPDKEGQMYVATEDNLYLIPTAEVPLTNIFRDVIISPKDLPIKMAGYTPCFRREAGSWGAHVRGLNRLHQFDKIEIVQIVSGENSYLALDEMVLHVENVLKKLELPYRILRLCGGDMSFSSALTYDFEVYSAAQKRWLEVSSVSNFENFQANRLKLRQKTESKTELLHTLNGSALALPRILAAILENYQTPESIKIPKILVDYTGFEEIG